MKKKQNYLSNHWTQNMADFRSPTLSPANMSYVMQGQGHVMEGQGQNVTGEHNSSNFSELSFGSGSVMFHSPFEILFYRYVFIVIYVIIFAMCVCGEFN